jgi:hypothetical protein
MKMKYVLTIILGAFFSANNVIAQNNYYLRANVGTTSLVSPIGGYYFSFDVGIPIVNGFEITPTFTSGTSLPNSYFENTWTNDSISPITTRVRVGGPKQEIEKGTSFSAFSILVNFRPFDLSEKNKNKRHELLMGGGFSYLSYAFVRVEYEIKGNNYEMISMTASSKRGIDLYIFKLSYSYFLKENLMLGGTASLFGIDGEAAILLGFQTGVKF